MKARNLVAKYARRFNKAAKHRDRTKYQRRPKHQTHHHGRD